MFEINMNYNRRVPVDTVPIVDLKSQNETRAKKNARKQRNDINLLRRHEASMQIRNRMDEMVQINPDDYDLINITDEQGLIDIYQSEKDPKTI